MNTQVRNDLTTGQSISVPSAPSAQGQLPLKLNISLPENIPLNQVLNATVRSGSDGQRGLVVQNTFLEIPLPEGLTDGDILKIVLKQVRSGLLLHILTSDGTSAGQTSSASPTFEMKDAFKNILKALLPELSLESMKKSYQEKASLIPLLQHAGQSLSAGDMKKIPELFEKFFEARALIPQQALKNSDQLTDILKNLIKTQSANQNAESQNILNATNTAQSNASRDISIEIGNLLKQELSHLLQNLNTEKSQTTTLLEQVKNLITPFLSTATLPEFQLPRPISENSLIGELFKTLLLLKHTASQQEAPFTESLKSQFESLSRFSSQLEKALEEGNQGDLKKALHKMLQSLSESGTHSEDLSQNESAQKTKTSDQPLARFLENILQTREQLGQLQPLMHTLGEPLFFLMPVIINGIFHNWEMRFDPYRASTKEQGKSKKGQGEFTRIHLAIELPSLGPIQIDIAHREKEILLSLKFAQEDVTDFVDSALPSLEKLLRNAGYEQMSLVTRTGEPEHVRPEWFHEVLEQTTVA